jgi:hypothetical protein
LVSAACATEAKMIWINAIALTFANFELRLIGQLQAL